MLDKKKRIWYLIKALWNGSQKLQAIPLQNSYLTVQNYVCVLNAQLSYVKFLIWKFSKRRKLDEWDDEIKISKEKKKKNGRV